MITEYVKGKPYFSDTDTKIPQHKYLDENICTDVLIIGGGIDGAITSYYFGRSGIDTVLIDKARLGYTNTACATALLEYQLDDLANDLKKHFSKEELVDVYRIGLQSLDDITAAINELGNRCNYAARDTLIYTLKEGERDALYREYEFRKENGFEVRFITGENNPFPFGIKAGVYAPGGGAEFNPYLFAGQMFAGAEKKSVRVYEHTEATRIIKNGGGFKVVTDYGIEINCNKVVCCTGYNTKLFTSKKLCDKYLSYTVVTNPLPGIAWHERCLLQDNAEPYHYLRLTPDDRVVIGGEDILFFNDTIKKKTAEKKYAALFEHLKELFAAHADRMRVDYEFCGAFSATGNNLAVIGESPDDENIWYNLGYGANGIIYSVFGAQLLCGLNAGKSDSRAKFFSPSRPLP